MKKRRLFSAALILLLILQILPAASKGGAQIREDSAVSSFTESLLRFQIKSPFPGFDEVEILADRTVLYHPDQLKIGTLEGRMLDLIDDGPVLMISSYGSMRMANLRLDGAFGNETPAEKDKRETYSGLRYTRNQEAVDLKDGIGKDPLSGYLRKLGASAVFQELLKREAASAAEPMSVRTRYDYLNPENYLIDDVFSVSASPEAIKLLSGAEVTGADAEMTIAVSAKKYEARVYLLHVRDDGSREMLAASPAGEDLFRFRIPLSVLTGHYLVLVSAAEVKDPKCIGHWFLIVLWLVTLIILARASFRRNWPRLVIGTVSLVLSIAVSAYAALIPLCYVDIYVTVFGLFVAYIVIRLKWTEGPDYLA